MKFPVLKYSSLILLIILLAGCTKEDSTSSFPQINDEVPVSALSISDPIDDLALAAAGPPALIPYSPVDIRLVRLWKADGYLYIRVDLAGVIPASPQTVSGQTVQQQGFNVSFDTDGNFSTGAAIGNIGGVDIYFAVLTRYGQAQDAPYANFNFQNSDIHSSTGHIEGEFRNGGPGYSYLTYRFSLASISTLFPSNRPVVLGGWAEAESSQFHHFAYDEFSTVYWIIPKVSGN